MNPVTACNKQPPPEHAMHGTGVACHMAAGHEGGCAWDTKPSKARRGIDKLLALMSHREIELISNMLPDPIEIYDVDENGVRAAKPYRRWELPAGPWAIVRFVGGDEFAIWKRSGDVYRVGSDKAVEEDPILVLDDPRREVG